MNLGAMSFKTIKDSDDDINESSTNLSDYYDDEDIQLEAVLHNAIELEYMLSDFSPSFEVIKVAVVKEPLLYDKLSSALQLLYDEYLLPIADMKKKFIMDAIALVRVNGLLLKSLSYDIRSNETVQKYAVLNNATALQFAINPTLEVIKLAWLKNNGVVDIKYQEELTSFLIRDKLLLRFFLQHYPDATIFSKFDSNFLNSPEEIAPLCSYTFTSNACMLAFVGELVRKHKGIIALRVLLNPAEIAHIHEELIPDRDFIKLLLKLNPKALGYLPENYRKDEEIVNSVKEMDPTAACFSLLPQDVEYYGDFSRKENVDSVFATGPSVFKNIP